MNGINIRHLYFWGYKSWIIVACYYEWASNFMIYVRTCSRPVVTVASSIETALNSIYPHHQALPPEKKKAEFQKPFEKKTFTKSQLLQNKRFGLESVHDHVAWLDIVPC